MTEVSAASRLDRALDPVRAALIGDARNRAAAILAAADADAAAELARARAESARLLAEARAKGQAEAASLLDVERHRTRTALREAELSARRRAYDDLRADVADRLRSVLAGPRRGRAEETLRIQLIELLGPGARITPVPGGGCIGTAPGTAVDASVRALADAALAELGAEAEELWTA